jgi:hypothetical protein
VLRRLENKSREESKLCAFENEYSELQSFQEMHQSEIYNDSPSPVCKRKLCGDSRDVLQIAE